MKIKVKASFILVFITSNLFAQKVALTDNSLKTGLDSVVQKAALKYLKDITANGIVIGVTQNGKENFYRYGENKRGSGRLISAGLYYNVGSVAKTFVATILAQAVIENKVELTDDIRKYLPEKYPDLQYSGKFIRLVDLANHTSGLPGVFHNYPETALVSLKNKTLSQQADFFGSYNQDSLLKDLHALKPDTIPGTKFRYNSSGLYVTDTDTGKSIWAAISTDRNFLLEKASANVSNYPFFN